MMGAAVAATMAVTAAAVTICCFKFNSLTQQGEIAFTTMLQSGDKAKSIFWPTCRTGRRTPLPEYATLMEASQKMLAMGFTENDVLPTLTAIGDAVSGLGGGQEKIDRVVIALGQMQAKGKAASQEMMQLTEAGIPAWEMLAESIGVSIPEAMKMVEKRTVDADTAIAAVVGGMNKRFGGMMAEQSKTFGGLWSTIMDTFRSRRGRSPKPLFDAVTRAFGRIVAFTNTPQFTAGVDVTAWKVAQLSGAGRGHGELDGVQFIASSARHRTFSFPAWRQGPTWRRGRSATRFLPAIKGVIRFVAAIPMRGANSAKLWTTSTIRGWRTLNRLRAFPGWAKCWAIWRPV